MDENDEEVPFSEDEKKNLLDYEMYRSALINAWIKLFKSPEEALAKN